MPPIFFKDFVQNLTPILGSEIDKTADAFPIIDIDGNLSKKITPLEHLKASVANKQVYVFEEADIGEAVAGVVTLADDTTYFIMAPLTTANTWEFGLNTNITASNNMHNHLTFTGAKAFTRTGVVQANLLGLTINGTGTNQLFDLVSDTLGGFALDNMFISNFGSLGNIDNVNSGWQRITVVGFTSGLTFTGGGYFGIDFSAFLTTSNTDVIAIAGTFTGTISVSVVSFATGVGGYALNLDDALAVGSAKVSLLGIAGGAIYNPTGLNERSLIVHSVANDGIPDSSASGIMSMSGNITETIITTLGVFEHIVGTTTALEEDLERFEHTASPNNRLTYIGLEPKRFSVHAIATGIKSGGTGGVLFDLALYKNGVAVPNALTTSDVSTRPLTIPLQFLVDLVTDDYIEIKIANAEGTDNITFSNFVVTIK